MLHTWTCITQGLTALHLGSPVFCLNNLLVFYFKWCIRPQQLQRKPFQSYAIVNNVMNTARQQFDRSTGVSDKQHKYRRISTSKTQSYITLKRKLWQHLSSLRFRWVAWILLTKTPSSLLHVTFYPSSFSQQGLDLET